jgi:hypothetical protein
MASALVGDGACAINPALTHELIQNCKKPAKNFKGKIVFLLHVQFMERKKGY